jgi:hypothetical protein
MRLWQADTFLNEIGITTEIRNGEMSDLCVTLANINVSASTFCEPKLGTAGCGIANRSQLL